MVKAQSAAIASTSKEVQPQPTKPFKQSSEQRKESPAAVRVISVPKSQIVLVNRSKRRINDPVDSNGVNLPSRSAQKKAPEVPPVKSSVAYSLQSVRSSSGISRPAATSGIVLPKAGVSASMKAPKNGQATRPVAGQSSGQGKVV